VRIHAELESYRDRLMERAAAWPETPETNLARELAQCEAQVALLERGVEALRARVAEAPAGPQAEALERRLSIQDQMRELTAAYAEVLRRHLASRAS
jgi:hypothetical protein